MTTVVFSGRDGEQASEGTQFASGGADSQVFLWNTNFDRALAADKALAAPSARPLSQPMKGLLSSHTLSHALIFHTLYTLY